MLVIHHLDHSRSERIVWLAEELGLDYRLQRHQRDPVTHRAPPALREVNPLGKAPAIEDGAVKLAESGAIIDYLLQRYGAGRLHPALGAASYPQYLHWMYAAEATLMVAPLTDLLTSRGPRNESLQGFLKADYANTLGYLNDLLSAQDYVAGNDFSAADIMVSFPLRLIAAPLFASSALLASLDDYPAVQRYMQRLRARPAWQRTAELMGE